MVSKKAGVIKRHIELAHQLTGRIASSHENLTAAYGYYPNGKQKKTISLRKQSPVTLINRGVRFQNLEPGPSALGQPISKEAFPVTFKRLVKIPSIKIIHVE